MNQFLTIVVLSLAVMAGASAMQSTDNAPTHVADAHVIPYSTPGKISAVR